MSIEENFDLEFVARKALREKQIQQVYRPIIAVHKWFARRPGSLFRSLTLAEFDDEPLATSYFRSHDFPGRMIADPFMGGGTPLLEANRVGCDVQGFDINPMAAWIVREEIEHIDLVDYQAAAAELLGELSSQVESFYLTDCPAYGDRDVPVKYFLWVKQLDCSDCGKEFDLFPGYVLSKDDRHPNNVVICSRCGELNEIITLKDPGKCRDCRAAIEIRGSAGRGRCDCPHCGSANSYPRPETGPPRHRMFGIEYYNPSRKRFHRGRFFKKPDVKDISRYQVAAEQWEAMESRFAPTRSIPPGDETNRLHRWGYKKYRELFNFRQLLGLELSAQLISKIANDRVQRALATNFSDLLRYQNMLCRYDVRALKSLDIFSVHGFPVGLVQCESNLFGISNEAKASVGSGGWRNVVEKYVKAKRYCDEPFEVRGEKSRRLRIPIRGEWIGEKSPGLRERNVSIRCESSTRVDLHPNSLDAVFTDPPYFGNVQYGELMDFCYAWLKELAGDGHEGFQRESSRASEELTGNQTQGRDLFHFTEGLAAVFSNMALALKPGAPLAFTYHHNKLEAYQAVAVAILDSGLTCSASIPCPAEMGGSIHIHGTGSSIIDTVFVCRDRGVTMREWLFSSPEELARLASDDLRSLRAAGLKGTRGDIRCIVFGHATRMAVWNLRSSWDRGKAIREKFDLIADELSGFGSLDVVIDDVCASPLQELPIGGLFAATERAEKRHHVISF